MAADWLDSLTITEPARAPGTAFRVTVPVVLEPPTTVPGEIENAVIRNGWTVKVATWVTPELTPLMVIVWSDVTWRWITANVAEDLPDASRTEAGTVAPFAFEVVNRTVTPAEGAGPLSVTVPVTILLDPPTTAFGDTVMLWSEVG